jgi:hypothetical protein
MGTHLKIGKRIGALGVCLLLLSCDLNPIKPKGDSPRSGVPDAPTEVTSVAGDGEATVSWTAPASDGGSAIIGYTAVAVEDTSKHCTTSGTSCTVAGLTNGTSYTFVVVAINAVGPSLASAPSDSGTPVTVPGAPTGVTAVAGDGQAIVSWTAPASDGGSAIIGYTAVAVEDTSKHCTTSGTSCTVAGLTNGTAYTFSVAAFNARGTSVASSLSLSTTPSPDQGVAWNRVVQPSNSGATEYFNSVAWTGSRLVVAAGGGRIVTSPDLFTWAVPATGVYGSFISVTWSGGQLVAVGAAGTILTSTDGVAWTQRSSGTTQTLNSAASDGKQIVAVGGGGVILASQGGTNWIPVTSGVSTQLNSVVWSGDQYVAVGVSGVILTSPDGVVWTQQLSGTSNHLTCVFAREGQLISVGYGGTILTSPNGADWTTRPSGGSQNLGFVIAGPNGSLMAAGNGDGILMSLDGASWTPYKALGFGNIKSAVWADDKYVAVSNDGLHALSVSTDGVTWTRVGDPFPTLSSVAWGDNGFVAAGETILTSANGVEWADSVSGKGFTGVAWGQGHYLAVGGAFACGGSVHGGTFFCNGSYSTAVSSDGRNWAFSYPGSFSGPEQRWLRSAAWIGTRWIAVGDRGVVMTSPDGQSWTTVSNSDNISLKGVEWTGGLAVAVGPQGVMTSTDGTLWTWRGGPTGLTSLVWAGSATTSAGQLVAVGTGGVIYTSPDGIAWTSRESGLIHHESLYGVTWTGTHFVAVGEGGVILTSRNGITWSVRNSGVKEQLNAVAWSGEKLVAVGNGFILTSP